jgi:uncharacterized membrane protein
MRAHPSVIIVFLAATMGFIFAGVSTYDSAVHLDRQVHGIHCSYFLGMGETDASGTSGCYATLMSPYSSMFRKSVWGGIPVALAGMAVFGYIAFAALWIIAKRRIYDTRAAWFLVLACLLPVLTSIFMAYKSVTELNTVCKICMGIYISSFASLIGALWLFFFAKNSEDPDGERLDPLSPAFFAVAFGLGVLFVAVPVMSYSSMAPDFSKFVGNCGKLLSPEDPGNILLPVGPQTRAVEMTEVMDPLCAACAAFESKFDEMPEKEQVRRRVMLFPLDKQCNWMVEESVHPGACAVSEAMLCANDDGADEVLKFAFANREKILEEAKKDPNAAARIMAAQFPGLARCIGSASARAKLNLSLRWAVKNRLHLLTPQIYIDGYRLCDEDTDLGLEFALSKLVSKNFTPGLESETPVEIGLPPLPPEPSSSHKKPKKADAQGEMVSPSSTGEIDLDAKLKQVNEQIDALSPKPADAAQTPSAPMPAPAPEVKP